MNRRLVMTDRRDADGSMFRAIALHGDGRLVITGHDLGPGVERFFGFSEYEFARTYSADDVQVLRSHLGLTADDDLLGAVKKRFESTHALEKFLADHGMTGKPWGRVGD